jgi:hypothetical protein
MKAVIHTCQAFMHKPAHVTNVWMLHQAPQVCGLQFNITLPNACGCLSIKQQIMLVINWRPFFR